MIPYSFHCAEVYVWDSTPESRSLLEKATLALSTERHASAPLATKDFARDGSARLLARRARVFKEHIG